MEMVTAADGTGIAYQRAGDGPPLVLVHGSGQDHTRWAASLPGLTRRASVYAIDRRGRGGSGDTEAYALEDEVNDLLAVLAAVDDPVSVLGHSYGAIIALEAALRTDRVLRLILYEPPINVGREPAHIDFGNRLAALMATGDREAVLVTFLQEGPRYPPDIIAAQRMQPEWPARLAQAHTLAREAQAVPHYQFDTARVAGLQVPTLLLLGSESPPFLRAATEALHAALPDSELAMLDGQHHNAMETAPDLFTKTVNQFLREARDDA